MSSVDLKVTPPPSTLTDVPDEIILDHLLPVLPLKDLLTFSLLSKHYNTLSSDEQLWSRKTLHDFTYRPSLLAPAQSTSKWSKRVYMGLSNPKTYVWGSSDNHRLGMDVNRRGSGIVGFRRWVDRPCELVVGEGSGARGWKEGLRDSLAGVDEGQRGKVGFVDLQASGWGFVARDMKGGVWAWGQMDGSMFGLRAQDWMDKHCPVIEPTVVPLPCKAESISAGRKHCLVLDGDNLIWELTSWGKAYHHTATSLTSPTNTGSGGHPRHILQISAGWEHSACLTSKGDIMVWYPFSHAYTAALTPDDALNGPLGVGDEGDASRALKWGTVGAGGIDTLEGIPERPTSEGQEWDEWEKGVTARRLIELQRVVKIDSGLDFIIALRGNGEVWYHRVKEDQAHSWQYLPHFSGPGISHITAQYQSITTYSTSSSALNHARIPPELPSASFFDTFHPSPLPTLQGKGVIQVSSGDYHNAALTSCGEVWTWGQGNHGELGLGGNRERVGEEGDPQRVVFGEEEAFCFGITAGGWHTGALVLGSMGGVGAAKGKERDEVPVADGEREESVREGGGMPGGFPGQGMGNHPALGGPMFRIGFAGRGGMRGGGMIPSGTWRSGQPRTQPFERSEDAE